MALRAKQKIQIRRIIKTVKDPGLSGSFMIRDVAELLSEKDMVQQLHRHDFFLILVLEKGKGKHVIDFVSYPVNDHSVFFIKPGQVHELTLKKGSTGFLMQFDPGFYLPREDSERLIFRKVSNKNHCPMKSGQFNKLHSILKNIFDEYISKQENFISVIKADLEIFFIELARQSKNSKSISQNSDEYSQSQLEIFLELLQTHLSTNKQVADYAKMMHLSTYQLNAITKTTLGKACSAVINDHIILEAKRALLATSNRVNQIADELGYEDASYFIRFFKNHTGHSPETFRKNFK